MSQSSQSEPPPTSASLIAGKYHLVHLIGRGGMGSVWEARHASLGTRFAIKFIEAEYADSQEARSRFDKEARAAATIQSKHAIQIYDHGVTEDGKPYIVMELLQGEPLDKRIERLGRLSLIDTARIVQQVSRGLARAHERGIVHRDLKPENIFLVRTPDEDDEIAKVLDFGIAKVQNSPHNPGVSSSTKTGAVLGTPFYMSPEQARGLRNVDHRTDVWSLGVIAFKCVSGVLPFDGESVGDLLVKICTSPIPVPSQVVAGVPSSFDAWFMRALERDPERRFSSVQELAEGLAFAAGISSRGVPSGAGSAQPSSPTFVTGPTPTPYTPRAPQGAAMTGSPFTAPAEAPASSSRWKVVLGMTLAGVVIAGAAIGVTVGLRQRQVVEATGLAQAAPPPLSAEPAPPTPPTASAVMPAAPPAVETAQPEPSPVAAKKEPAPKPTRSGSKTKPATTGTAEKPVEKPAATTTSAPTPPKKTAPTGTNKHDPGY